MNDSADIVESSYAVCRRISRRASSSLYSGFLLPSGAKRRGMDALYAFARLTDDIVDGTLPLDERRRRLAFWRHAMEDALGQSDACIEAAGEQKHAGDLLCVLPALADTAERFSIPREHFSAMIDGAAMDLEHNRFRTFAELEGYCRHVASSVGLACVHIWGFRGDEVFEPAEKCGIALQLTNILRDVKEDLARDRVYLPQEDLRRHDYTEDDLRRGIADARFMRLMAEQIERAECYYREGTPALQYLEPCGRRACGAMIDRYRALLDAIRRRPAEVLRRRVTLSAPSKARLALRWLLGRHNPNHV